MEPIIIKDLENLTLRGHRESREIVSNNEFEWMVKVVSHVHSHLEQTWPIKEKHSKTNDVLVVTSKLIDF